MTAISAEEPDAARREAMALLARATRDRLDAVFAALDPTPVIADIRAPETGLIMVRGRMGGSGRPFNLGEATVTRATVRLAGGPVGFAHILGRDRAKARLAAVFDALFQVDPVAVERLLLSDLRAALAEEDRIVAEETAATRVDFFTMVRGE